MKDKYKYIRSLPVHSFILPLFFILHILNEYHGLIPFRFALLFLLYYTVLSSILIGIGYFFFRSVVKAGIWTTGFLIVFYFFGAAHDLLKGISVLAFVTSYKVLLPFLLILFGLCSIMMWHSKKPFKKTHKYLNQLFLLLLAFESVIFLQKSLSGISKENNYALNNKESISIQACDSCKQPDIFFIVFDEYTSSIALKKYFRFDNSFIDSAFKANDFYISEKSKSNYNSTPLSIGAAFNLQYFNKDLEHDSTITKSLLQGWHSLEKSRIPGLLGSRNYEILNFGLSRLDHYPSREPEGYTEYKIKPLFLETLWGRIKRDIWWNIYKYNIGFINKSRDVSEKRNREMHISRNNSHFKNLMHELDVQNNRPKFVFCHLLLPHDPFYLDRYGNRLPDSISATNLNKTALYLEQLQYSNQLLMKIISASNKKFPRERVIIIEGDHGFRIPGAEREAHFMNLNAYYFSDHNYSNLYDSISPVNTFRVIMNKYFQSDLQLLKDSTILLK